MSGLASLQAQAQASRSRYQAADPVPGTLPHESSSESLPLAEAEATGQQQAGSSAKRAGSNRKGGLLGPMQAESPRQTPGQQPASSGNERLYEAYNELHALAQKFDKPFDAPAILVVGHQTDGKSALVEALMGFQFNSVGGGTKTRRPIALHMKYNAAAMQPACFLINDSMQEREMALEQLQAYIEAENGRLEAEQQFSSKEIVVRVEYKYCPNLTIIDTPGLISAAPGKRNGPLQAFSQQVESMVRAKMEQPEFVILCLEDTNDWSNATTRRLVMQVDPSLTRTVLVATKFDAKLPQFSRGADVDMYLHPTHALGLGEAVGAQLGGGPFFTSVPSGRVGGTADDVFRANDEFRAAVAEREAKDIMEAEAKLGRRLEKAERSHLGVSQLRGFLEQLLQRRYLDSVPSIVPLLERESRLVQSKLNALEQELGGLAHERLKDKGRHLVEAFLSKLHLLLRGTVSASPEKFGETLADEHARGGTFLGPSGKVLSMPESLPNGTMRLFGGAQFHRAMSEFRLAVGQVRCPEVTREEVANTCGVDDLHDGVNYLRTACLVAVTRAQDLFEPLLHQLGFRLTHVVGRLLPISLHLVQRDAPMPAGHEIFMRRISTSYNAFVEEVEEACKARCLEDLQSTTRYVTWSLHTKSTLGLRSVLSKAKSGSVPIASSSAGGGGGGSKEASSPLPPGAPAAIPAPAAEAGPNLLMLDLLEGTLWNRQLSTTSDELIGALINLVFEGIRDYVIQCAELKFNCFFLMPLVDAFPMRLRIEVERALDEDLDEVFDVGAVRAVLEERRASLQAELKQVERLQRAFAGIHATLMQQQACAALAGPAQTGPRGGGAVGHGTGVDGGFGAGAADGHVYVGRLDAHMLSLTDSVATSVVHVAKGVAAPGGKAAGAAGAAGAKGGERDAVAAGAGGGGGQQQVSTPAKGGHLASGAGPGLGLMTANLKPIPSSLTLQALAQQGGK